MSNRRITVKLFVGSPGDTKPEREALADVVEEINQTVAEDYGLWVDLIRWETHAFPGKGEDAQDVINRQLPDFDAFLGILWSRFGTPTSRADSGTEEEFQKALAIDAARDGGIPMMVYFKDEALPPSQMDPVQLQKVQEFRTRVAKEGCLHWPFSDTEDFTRQVRLHLIRQLRQLRSIEPEIVAPAGHSETKSDAVDEDEGFLDAIERGTEMLQQSTSVAERLTESIGELGEKTKLYASQLNELDGSEESTKISASKQILNLSADTLTHYARHVEEEIPLFKDSYSEAIRCFERAAVLLDDFDAPDLEDLRLTARRIEGMRDSLKHAGAGVGQLRQTVAGLPRVTTRFNRAKRAATAAMDRLESELDAAVRLTDQTATLLTEVIRGHEDLSNREHS